MPLQRRKVKQQKSQSLGGVKLRALRDALGLSLEDVAAEIEADLEKHVDASHINKIEKGIIKKPFAETLEAILAGLHATYRDRRDVLEAFGYAVPMTLPTEQEVEEGKRQAAYALDDATYPVYLIDYGQRLWAWNRYLPRLIGLHPDDPATSRFFGVTTVDLAFNPAFETRLVLANPDEYLPVMLQFLKAAIYPFHEQPWYQELLAQWSTFPGFSTLWDHVPADTLRSVVPIKANVPGSGVLQFRLSSADLLLDPRFQIFHLTPFGATTLRACAEWAEEEGKL
jgi:transcriptional regulator with XRE-family HTH domain